MQFLVIIFSFFIFFYSLYILGKDDYVLIRRNLTLEQLFDFAFFGIFSGILLVSTLSIIFHPATSKSFMSQLFFPRGASFNLTTFVFGCMVGLYLIGKYRKLPTGRLFDFFSLALLSALPAGYLISVFFIKRSEIIYFVIPGVFYLGLQVFFWRFLLQRMISGKLREGSLCSLFLLTFSAVSIFVYLFYQLGSSSLLFQLEDLLVISIFIGSFLFLLRNERKHVLRHKT